MLRYDRQTKPGLVALYDIRPGNGVGPFLQPRSPHGALKIRMMEVMLTTGAVSRAKLQSNRLVTINKPTPKFVQAGCPSCCPTNSVTLWNNIFY